MLHWVGRQLSRCSGLSPDDSKTAGIMLKTRQKQTQSCHLMQLAEIETVCLCEYGPIDMYGVMQHG